MNLVRVDYIMIAFFCVYHAHNILKKSPVQTGQDVNCYSSVHRLR